MRFCRRRRSPDQLKADLREEKEMEAWASTVLAPSPHVLPSEQAHQRAKARLHDALGLDLDGGGPGRS